MSMVTTSNAIDSLNALLRSSLSACETYQKAIRKIEKDKDRQAVALRVTLKDHADHAERLRHEILGLGGTPEASSGAWGAWAKAVEGAASFFGETTMLKALREGEQHALSLTLSALIELEGSALTLVRDTIQPSIVQHLELLEAILAAA